MSRTTSKMKNYQMWIGGKWMNAGPGKTIPVINPSNEEVIASIQVAGETDVDKAVAAARKALPIWSGKSQTERSRIVNQIAVAIRENSSELANIEMLDHGMPIHTATSFSVQAAASHCEYMSQVT
jgi:acyl-CoA reductase-like NAD-dependent aldehyde dehydrogenase